LFAYPGVVASWRLQGSTKPASNLPMIPIGFKKDGQILRYFSMVTAVGAPQSVAAQELRVESLFLRTMKRKQPMQHGCQPAGLRVGVATSTRR